MEGLPKEFGRLEREAVYRVRELFAGGRELSLRVSDREDEGYIREMANYALYPECPSLSFEGASEEELDRERDYEREQVDFLHLARRFGFKRCAGRLIACGGVDDGKSTLIGRILFDAKTPGEQELVCKNPAYLRKDGSVDFALLAGVTDEEARQGITVQASYSAFDWQGAHFLMADVPGHEEYTHEMARAASMADTAIIMIAANKGIVPQTRRHVRICYFMGIRHMIFAVNKMDMVSYAEGVFLQHSEEIRQMMEEFSDCGSAIVPLAAKGGVNIIKHDGEMNWYRGVTLLEAIAGAGDAQGKKQKTYFCMPVQRICKSSQMAGAVVKKRVIQGEIASGTLRAGDTVFVYPTGKRAKAETIYRLDEKTDTAEAGDPVGIELDREPDVARGYVLAGEDALALTERVEADLLWTLDNRMTQGKRYLALAGTMELTAAVTKIYYQTDVNTGEHRHAEYLTKNALARCELCFPKPVALTCEKESRALGTIRLYDKESGALAAYGNIVHTISDEEWAEDGREVLAGEREAAMGQKAGLVLFARGAGTAEHMNYAERHLLRMGFHTVQLAPEKIDERELLQVRRLLDAGLIVLLRAQPQDEEAAAGLLENRERVFDCTKVPDLTGNMGNVLKKMKEWAAGLI